jgi:hypothetical protein
MNANCVFDVRITGERGFAQTYYYTQLLKKGATLVTVVDTTGPAAEGEPATFVATVARTAPSAKEVPAGSVQFTVNGEPQGAPVPLDASGRALWTADGRKAGRYDIGAIYVPAAGSGLLSSISPALAHEVKE